MMKAVVCAVAIAMVMTVSLVAADDDSEDDCSASGYNSTSPIYLPRNVSMVLSSNMLVEGNVTASSHVGYFNSSGGVIKFSFVFNNIAVNITIEDISFVPQYTGSFFASNDNLALQKKINSTEYNKVVTNYCAFPIPNGYNVNQEVLYTNSTTYRQCMAPNVTTNSTGNFTDDSNSTDTNSTSPYITIENALCNDTYPLSPIGFNFTCEVVDGTMLYNGWPQVLPYDNNTLVCMPPNAALPDEYIFLRDGVYLPSYLDPTACADAPTIFNTIDPVFSTNGYHCQMQYSTPSSLYKITTSLSTDGYEFSNTEYTVQYDATKLQADVADYYITNYLHMQHNSGVALNSKYFFYIDKTDNYSMKTESNSMKYSPTPFTVNSQDFPNIYGVNCRLNSLKDIGAADFQTVDWKTSGGYDVTVLSKNNSAFEYQVINGNKFPSLNLTFGEKSLFQGFGNGTIVTYQTQATMTRVGNSSWIAVIDGVVTETPVWIGVDLTVLDKVIQHYDLLVYKDNTFSITLNISKGVEETSVFRVVLTDPFIQFNLALTENVTQFNLPGVEKQEVFTGNDLTLFLNVGLLFIGTLALFFVLLFIGIMLRRYRKKRNLETNFSKFQPQHLLYLGVYITFKILFFMVITLSVLFQMWLYWNSTDLGTLQQFPAFMKSYSNETHVQMDQIDAFVSAEIYRQQCVWESQKSTCETHIGEETQLYLTAKADNQAYNNAQMDARNITDLRYRVTAVNIAKIQALQQQIMQQAEQSLAATRQQYTNLKSYTTDYLGRAQTTIDNGFTTAENYYNDKLNTMQNKINNWDASFKSGFGWVQSDLKTFSSFFSKNIVVKAIDFFTNYHLPDLSNKPWNINWAAIPYASNYMAWANRPKAGDDSSFNPNINDALQKVSTTMETAPQIPNPPPYDFDKNSSVVRPSLPKISFKIAKPPGVEIEKPSFKINWSLFSLPYIQGFGSLIFFIDAIRFSRLIVRTWRRVVQLARGHDILDDMRDTYAVDLAAKGIKYFYVVSKKISKLWLKYPYLFIIIPRLLIICAVVFILAMFFLFAYYCLQVDALQHMGVITMMTSPLLVDLAVANQRVISNAQQLNTLQIPSYKLVAAFRLNGLEANADFYNLDERLEIDRFNRELCFLSQQLDEECNPVQQSYLVFLTEPCSFTPIVASLYTFDSEYYGEQTKAGLKPFVDAARNIVLRTYMLAAFVIAIGLFSAILTLIFEKIFEKLDMIRVNHAYIVQDDPEHPDEPKVQASMIFRNNNKVVVESEVLPKRKKKDKNGPHGANEVELQKIDHNKNRNSKRPDRGTRRLTVTYPDEYPELHDQHHV